MFPGPPFMRADIVGYRQPLQSEVEHIFKAGSYQDKLSEVGHTATQFAIWMCLCTGMHGCTPACRGRFGWSLRPPAAMCGNLGHCKAATHAWHQVPLLLCAGAGGQPQEGPGAGGGGGAARRGRGGRMRMGGRAEPPAAAQLKAVYQPAPHGAVDSKRVRNGWREVASQS